MWAPETFIHLVHCFVIVTSSDHSDYTCISYMLLPVIGSISQLVCGLSKLMRNVGGLGAEPRYVRVIRIIHVPDLI